LLALAAFPALSLAAEPPSYSLEIQDKAFAPPMLTIEPGQRVKLVVSNSRILPSEFESYDLNSEKVVPGHSTVSVWIGPLKPGKYKFFDDFNPRVTGWIFVPGGKTGGPAS
jgi:hypothetical protein